MTENINATKPAWKHVSMEDVQITQTILVNVIWDGLEWTVQSVVVATIIQHATRELEFAMSVKTILKVQIAKNAL